MFSKSLKILEAQTLGKTGGAWCTNWIPNIAFTKPNFFWPIFVYNLVQENLLSMVFG